MKRLVFVMICVCGCFYATAQQVSSDNAKCPCSVKPPHRDEVQTVVHEPVITQPVDEKCGCSVKPPHKDDLVDEKCGCGAKPPHKDDIQAKCPCQKPPHRSETVEDKCPCQKPPHRTELAKETTGADLFVNGTQGIMLCVQGGVLAQKEGNIKVALPYIFQGLSILTDMASRSPNPQQAYQELYRFMNSLDKHELDILAKKALK